MYVCMYVCCMCLFYTPTSRKSRFNSVKCLLPQLNQNQYVVHHQPFPSSVNATCLSLIRWMRWTDGWLGCSFYVDSSCWCFMAITKAFAALNRLQSNLNKIEFRLFCLTRLNRYVCVHCGLSSFTHSLIQSAIHLFSWEFINSYAVDR